MMGFKGGQDVNNGFFEAASKLALDLKYSFVKGGMMVIFKNEVTLV